MVSARNIILRPHQDVSARETFSGVKLNIKRDFRAKFGDYIQAMRPPSDTQINGPTRRTVAALFLGSTFNSRGTIRAYDLNTHRTFTCDKFTILPMPTMVVKAIFDMWSTDEPRVESIKFFGYIADGNGYRYEDSRIKALTDIQFPETGTEAYRGYGNADSFARYDY